MPTQARAIEHWPLAKLAAHPRNPKAHDADLIGASVSRFGYIEPVVIDQRTGQIISGHGRTDTLRALEAAGELPPDGITVDPDTGAWLAPVVVGWSSRSDTEANAALIALNRSTEAGGWVDDTLLELLGGLADVDGGLDGVGYGADDIDELRARLAALTDDDPADDSPARPIRQPAEGPGTVTLYHGDNLHVMAALADQSIDAVVCDPPYAISFMGRSWDEHGAPAEFADWCQTWAAECLRLLKPGGHLVAFGATRTHHRLMAGIEDAGFQIRDCGVWLYRTGFPKSANMTDPMDRWQAGDPAVGKVRDDLYRVTRFLREARDKAGWNNKRIDALFDTHGMAGHWTSDKTQPQVPSVRQWAVLKEKIGFGDDLDDLVAALGAVERPDDWGQGEDEDAAFLADLRTAEFGETQAWGTALKPSIEPWVLARKPPVGTTAQNVQTYGTGALNIEGCRVDMSEEDREKFARGSEAWHRMALDRGTGNKPADVYGVYGITDPSEAASGGRWPANVITGEPDEDLRFFRWAGGQVTDYPKAGLAEKPWGGHAAGCPATGADDVMGTACTCGRGNGGEGSVLHPTVKPVALMRHLVRMVTPPGGTVLDLFAGTGTTGEAAVVDGFDAVLIEREESYLPLIRTRLAVDPSPLPEPVES